MYEVQPEVVRVERNFELACRSHEFDRFLGHMLDSPTFWKS